MRLEIKKGRVVKYEVIVHGVPVAVNNLQEAEKRMNGIEQSDFAMSYILRKEYSKTGKLLDEIMVG
jgi:hypothetical protein